MLVDRPDGMLNNELQVLRKLIQDYKSVSILEIGLANASSAIVILEEIFGVPNSSLTSIDPFQNDPVELNNDSYRGYAGQGVLNIHNAGFACKHELIEELSYLALPQLVRQKKQYDLILIDGYHSFDYTFIDYFYSDLLLKDGGILIIHDTNWQTVYPVCKFILENKDYRIIGPKIEPSLNKLWSKIIRRGRYLIIGNYQEFKLRKDLWSSLGTFQKISTTQCSQYVLKGISFKH